MANSRAIGKRLILAVALLGLTVGLTTNAEARIGPRPTVTVAYALPPVLEGNARGDTIVGGCFFVAIESSDITNATTQGIVGEVSATTGPTNRPTGATVHCWMDLNGADQPDTHVDATGTGVQIGVPKQISLIAVVGDSISLCQSVIYDDFSTEPTTCQAATTATLPPPAIDDAADVVTSVLDPFLCPALVLVGRDTGGGVPGVLTIEPDGDIVVDDLYAEFGPIYDCPPY